MSKHVKISGLIIYTCILSLILLPVDYAISLPSIARVLQFEI